MWRLFVFFNVRIDATLLLLLFFFFFLSIKLSIKTKLHKAFIFDKSVVEKRRTDKRHSCILRTLTKLNQLSFRHCVDLVRMVCERRLRRGTLRTHSIKVPSAEHSELLMILSSKAGVGQNIAMRASPPTACEFYFLMLLRSPGSLELIFLPSYDMNMLLVWPFLVMWWTAFCPAWCHLPGLLGFKYQDTRDETNTKPKHKFILVCLSVRLSW